ncbi:MAG: hypothetical protein ACUVTZ_11880 [Armatimonadota bacterium]
MDAVLEVTADEATGRFRAVLLVKAQGEPNRQFVSFGDSRKEALDRLLWLVRTMPDGGSELARYAEGLAHGSGQPRRSR